MKFEPEVKKNIRMMFIGDLCCSLIAVIGFVIFGKFDYTVAVGAAVGFLLSFFNFLGMACGVEKALENNDEDKAKMKLRSSYITRTVIMLAVMAAAIALDFIHWVPVVLSVFYPRIVITVCGAWKTLFGKKADDSQSAATAENKKIDLTEEEEKEETDEFEKFVSRFKKGKVPGEDIKNINSEEESESDTFDADSAGNDSASPGHDSNEDSAD